MAVSEAQKRATAKFEKERYDKILTRFPKGTKERILKAGAKSINRFIIDAVNEKLARQAGETEEGIGLEDMELAKAFEVSAGQAGPLSPFTEPEVEEKTVRWSRQPMTDQQIEDCARAIERGKLPFYFIDQIHMRNEMGEENFSRLYEAVSKRRK